MDEVQFKQRMKNHIDILSKTENGKMTLEWAVNSIENGVHPVLCSYIDDSGVYIDLNPMVSASDPHDTVTVLLHVRNAISRIIQAYQSGEI